MFLVPVAVLSAAAASLAYFLMKPKEEEYDYDSDESAMSDMSPSCQDINGLRGNQSRCPVNSPMISPVTCKFNSLPSIQVTNTTGSSRSASPASPASPAKQKPRKESPSTGARGCCTPQRSQSLQPIRHSNNCPMIKKQQDQRSLCQRQQEQYNLQQLHRVQQPQTSSQCCSLHQSQMMANSSFNHDQRLCPMNQNLATAPADYRHECLMAIASMRNNLYEGTQKVMQCIQILNGLDHFLRNTK